MHAGQDELDQENRRERYRSFILHQLSQRPIHGKWTELPLLLLISLLNKKTLGSTLRGFRAFRKDQRGWQTFIERAVPVMAYPIMVNSILRRPGTQPSAGLVLVSFEQVAPAEMAEIALRLED